MRLMSWSGRRRESFDPRSRSLALARTIMATAQLVSIVLTPTGDLFVPEIHNPSGVRCTGLRDLSLWCATGPGDEGLHVGGIVAVAVLLGVAVGYRPRWTCIPHWYVTASLGMSATQPWGGDGAASIATLLLIPILLEDRRLWQWTRPTSELQPWWQGAACAAWWLIRIQVAVIYVDAALSKLMVPQWRAGTAMYTVFADPDTGILYGFRRLATPVLNQDLVMRALTLSIPLLELAIAFCVLGPRPLRKKAVLLAMLLHVGIAVLMGLIEFAVVMVCMVMLCVIEESGPGNFTKLPPEGAERGMDVRIGDSERKRNEPSDIAMGSVHGGF